MTRREKTFEWLRGKFELLQALQEAGGLVIDQYGFVLGKIHIDESGIWSEVAIMCGLHRICEKPDVSVFTRATKAIWKKYLSAYRVVEAKHIKKINLQ